MKLSRNLAIILLIVVNIAVDQISKLIVDSKMNLGETIEVFGNTFILQYVKNSGAFLGMGSELNDTLRIILLILLPVLVLSYLVFYIFKNKHLDKLAIIGLSCIAGGGIANIFDRIAYGKVIDFLHLDFGGVFRTGIFNLADVSVTSGMILLLLGSFFPKKKTTVE